MTVTLPFERPALRRRSGSASLSSLSDVQDMVYLANVTVGGVSFPVQLDTGSSDLVIIPSPGSIPKPSQSSPIDLNLTYGIGWLYGQVAFAPTNFAGINVPQQAYLNASSAQDPAMSYGAAGILGLGFDSLSNIDFAINGTGSSSGRSLLYNLFHDNLQEPNFIAFSLQSTSDSNGVHGSLSVGETDPSYANVTSTNKIPTWPVIAPSRWTVLLDSFIVGTQTHVVSSTVPGAPLNKAIVLLDSGTSYTYAPADVCTAIYGGIPGARYDPSFGQWTVNCSAEIDIAIQIDDQIFPIHPLDVSPASLGDPNSCVGSFIPQAVTVGAGHFDWLIGDNVLRSIYTLYDFGDFDSSGNMGNPYVQMLPLVDPVQASIEFHKVRGGTPNTNITYSVSNPGSASGSITVTVPTDVATVLEIFSKFLPAILGVVALNALALIVLIVVGIIILCKRRGKTPRARKIPGRLSPMAVGDPVGTRDVELSVNVPHTYQPVSMAMTEDTLFVPPTPGFKAESSRFGDRPSSIA